MIQILDGMVIKEETYIIFKYLQSPKFTEFYINLNILQIKKYMLALIKSIEIIHKIGIIHRDIKPDNFLYNFDTDQFMLIDFGLAEVYIFYKVRSLLTLF